MNRRSFFPAFGALGFGFAGCTRSADRVVVYCSQDEEFAAALFADFEKRTGIAVAPKFDTEANKSVGLTAELVQEKALPRCDVHWNNEPLGTIRLQRQSVYASHVPFASRARVLVVNAKLMPDGSEPQSLFDLALPKWRGKIAMAKPLFGTTATHMACLFAALTSAKAKELLLAFKANDLQLVSGNKQVALRVAEGEFAVGLTDTDDAIIEVNRGKPVKLIHLDEQSPHEKLGTLFLPNTLALVTGGPNPSAGRKLIDFLMAPEQEDRLAEGGAFQIPHHLESRAKLHLAIRTAKQVRPMTVDFEKAADAWDECREFLKETFTQ